MALARSGHGQEDAMRMIRKCVAGVALLALAGCAQDGDHRGTAQGTGGKSAVQNRGVDHAALGDGTVTLAAAGLSDTVYFDYDKTTLRPDPLPALLRIA